MCIAARNSAIATVATQPIVYDENHDQGTDIINFYNIESKTCPCGAGNFPKVNLGVENPFPCSKLRFGAQNDPFSGYSVPFFMLNYTAAVENCLSGQHNVRGGVCCTLAANDVGIWGRA